MATDRSQTSLVITHGLAAYMSVCLLIARAREHECSYTFRVAVLCTYMDWTMLVSAFITRTEAYTRSHGWVHAHTSTTCMHTFMMLGSSWLCHRSLICFPVRFGRNEATSTQLLSPCFSTSLRTSLSSCEMGQHVGGARVSRDTEREKEGEASVCMRGG
jgi:hypothetical protein